MSATAFEDRAAGALMGALIGDALGVGPHWYYNLHELRAAYGPWISDYTTPKPGRYHDGLKAGESSQAGFLLELTMKSLAERGGYDEADFSKIKERIYSCAEAALSQNTIVPKERCAFCPWKKECRRQFCSKE